jgi:hypothetical protein
MRSIVIALRASIMSFALLVSFSATSFGQGWFNSEKDEVYNSQRMWVEFANTIYANRSSMGSLAQTFLKETRDSTSSYKVYDVLTLSGKCFDINKDVYILIDEKPFSIDVLTIERMFRSDVSLDHTKVLKTDSTVVSAVTGYNPNNLFVYRVYYQLSPLVVDKILLANKVAFRYYSGPYMLTAKLTLNDLNRLQRILKKS